MEKVITIDGLASSGKSALARALAKKLSWPWLSTGVFYRGMAYVGEREKLGEKGYLRFFQSGDWRVELTPDKSLFFYKGEDISARLYEEKIDDLASLFSSKAVFRKALIPAQRAFYSPGSKKGLILEGRDCGTVLFPSAPLKLFLLAEEETRAERRAKDRHKELKAVFQAQKRRDKRDQTRSFAPLIQPKNSLRLNSGEKSLAELADLAYRKAQSLFL